MDLKPADISPELASAALASEALSCAVKLADWVGQGRDMTGSGVLRPAVATQACAALGIDLPAGKKLRSAQDVPELMRDWEVARSAGLITVSANQAYGLGSADLAGDAGAVLDAWLRAVTAPFGLSDDLCTECLTVLGEITKASPDAIGMADLQDAVRSLYRYTDAPCPDCGEIHPLDDEDEVPEQHTILAVANLLVFGATIPAGDPDQDQLTLTPLGRMLADSVFAVLAPAPGDSACALMTQLGFLPPGTAILYATDWLDARTPVAAARELFDFAESATSRERVLAFSFAAQIGPGTTPAWRERAGLPGYGVYARAWLREQGEDVPELPGDEAWLVTETFSALLDKVPPEFASMALGLAMQEAGAADVADAVATLRESGHPDAHRLIEVIGGGNTLRPVIASDRATRATRAAKSWPALAPDGAKAYQLMITLREVDDPPIWRRVAVPASATIGDLHVVIQAVMGWEGGHMHAFYNGGRELGAGMPLREALPRRGSRIQYTYDFGDDWAHDVQSEGFFQNDMALTLPFCLDGSGACPPEDCGGAWRYEYIKSEILTDPDHDEHDDMLDWLGLDSSDDFDPAVFSPDEVNARLVQLWTADVPDERPAAEVILLQPRTKKPKGRRKR